MTGLVFLVMKRAVWLAVIRYCLPGLLGALLSRPAHAQASQPFEFARPRARRAEFTFISQRNLIVVAARLNGRGPYHFLLDTGVSTSILTNAALVDSLHLVRGEELLVVGSGGEATPLRAYRSGDVRVELPGLVAPRMQWLLLSDDVLNLSGYAGTHIDGILGGELFQSLVVTIWPTSGRIVCRDPARYQPPRGRAWASLPLHLERGKAYVEAGIRQIDADSNAAALPLRLVLDTGAGHALSLENSADPRLHLPPEHLRADLGRGLSGIIHGYIGRVATVQLGRYQLPRVLTSFPDAEQVHLRLPSVEAQRQGNLGFEVLKRFTVVFDYPHQRLLLRPTAAWREPFEHDMSGLDLLAVGAGLRQYLVVSVRAGSPAEEAGICVDEELLAVNFLPAGQFALSEITRLLRIQHGKRLLLLLRRPDGELHAVSLYLRRQI